MTREFAESVPEVDIGRNPASMPLKTTWLVEVGSPDTFAQGSVYAPTGYAQGASLPLNGFDGNMSLHPIAAGLGAQPQQTSQFQNAQPSLFVMHLAHPLSRSAPPSQFLLDALSGEDATPGARSVYSPLPLKDDLSEMVSTHPKSSSRLRIRQVAGWRTPFAILITILSCRRLLFYGPTSV